MLCLMGAPFFASALLPMHSHVRANATTLFLKRRRHVHITRALAPNATP